MDTFITTAGALGLVKAVVDCVKYVRAGNANGYVTQIAVWVAGIAVVALLKWSDYGDTIAVGFVSLHDANLGTVILAGLGLGSAAMLANEFKTAIDRTDSAVKPDLISTRGPNLAAPRVVEHE